MHASVGTINSALSVIRAARICPKSPVPTCAGDFLLRGEPLSLRCCTEDLAPGGQLVSELRPVLNNRQPPEDKKGTSGERLESRGP